MFVMLLQQIRFFKVFGLFVMWIIIAVAVMASTKDLFTKEYNRQNNVVVNVT